MALATKVLALISVSALLLSIEAQFAPSPSIEPTAVSYISSSPDASPASAPAEAVQESSSSVFEMNDALLGDMPLPDVSVSKMVVAVDQKQVTQMVEKSMQKIEQKIDEFNTLLKQRLQDPDTSATTQECINQCDEVYGAAVEDIKKSIDSLNSGNLIKANFDISSISTNVDTCEQCFNEMIGEDPELKKFDEWVRGVTSQALGSLIEISS